MNFQKRPSTDLQITRYVTLAWKDANNIVEEMSPKPEEKKKE
jgi:hypothetical protein